MNSAPKSRQLECPACGGSTQHQFLYVRNGCEILRCRECGLGRTEAREFDPTGYYTKDYFSGGHGDGYADYVGAEPVLRREFAHCVGFIRRRVPAGRLLELGCAYGFFLQEAREHFDVAGIEIAADAAAHCRAHGLDVRTGVADEAAMAELGPADVIVLLDVIEHLPDPRATVALCARHLAPGGALVLTTGDFASPVARLSGPRWRLMTPPQHLWFFTSSSIGRMCAASGLHVEALDHPWKLVPLSLIRFQLRRMAGLPPEQQAAGSACLPVNLFDAMRVVARKPA
jgi:2-polyprenyl-3-methyl-5-hydroxy-6-metoxy-1,4-benzoquinol methylase